MTTEERTMLRTEFYKQINRLSFLRKTDKMNVILHLDKAMSNVELMLKGYKEKSVTQDDIINLVLEGFSTRQIATMTGIPRSSISDIIMGTRKRPIGERRAGNVTPELGERIMKALSSGKSRKEIAAKFNLTYPTVAVYIHRRQVKEAESAKVSVHK